MEQTALDIIMAVERGELDQAKALDRLNWIRKNYNLNPHDQFVVSRAIVEVKYSGE